MNALDSGRWLPFATMICFMSLAFASPAVAQPCPHSMAGGVGIVADASGTGPTTNAFVGSGFNCTAQQLGAVANCQQVRYSNGFVNFIANWPSTAARTGDTTGGCQFNCPGGTCYVRNDGLPVELLQFGVE